MVDVMQALPPGETLVDPAECVRRHTPNVASTSCKEPMYGTARVVPSFNTG